MHWNVCPSTFFLYFSPLSSNKIPADDWSHWDNAWDGGTPIWLLVTVPSDCPPHGLPRTSVTSPDRPHSSLLISSPVLITVPHLDGLFHFTKDTCRTENGRIDEWVTCFSYRTDLLYPSTFITEAPFLVRF